MTDDMHKYGCCLGGEQYNEWNVERCYGNMLAAGVDPWTLREYWQEICGIRTWFLVGYMK